MKLDSIRKDYRYAALLEDHIFTDPVKQFESWINEALIAQVNEPTAMSVSTIGEDGFPQTRIVLLKGFDAAGFRFFTNYNSEKGRAIQQNPAVNLHFFWPELERQIRITGYAEKTSDEISADYFYSRPRLSQVAAVVSPQSQKISSRDFLETRFNELLNRLKNKEPERPEFWGGFQVKPVKIEFWQGRENRLHDRILYEKKEDRWEISRLAP